MRQDIMFDSHGGRCAAWLYLPPSAKRLPCVVMAHGFSAVREQRLDAFAEAFAAAGLAVLLFDYRHFGASSGEPRQLLSVPRQLQDWSAAIAQARAHPLIDPDRIALFGSSFSGGHVQAMAARDPAIAAVVALVPFCDGMRNLPQIGLAQALRLSVAGMRDFVASAFGGKPYRIAAVGMPGSLAIMTSPDAVPGFAAMTPKGASWRNEVCARIVLTVGSYRPGMAASRIRCPILYAIAENDVLAPARLARAAARRAPRAEVKTYDAGHFDPYVAPLWEKVVADETEFLLRHLKSG